MPVLDIPLNAALLAEVLAEVPVDPGAGEARRLLLDELSHAQYQQSQPNWLDRVATGFLDWLKSLNFGSAGGPPWTVLLVIAIVLVIGVGVAFLVFGAPRRDRRSAVSGSLFGDDDARDAAAMRADAAAAAGRGDFTLAIAELYRAIARDLGERTVLTVSPGTTAREFAVRAGRAFPTSADRLGNAAAAFDAVRYLGEIGTAQQYELVAALDRQIRATRPTLEPVGA
jgi:Domain of unknown function (DUF4129)